MSEEVVEKHSQLRILRNGTRFRENTMDRMVDRCRPDDSAMAKTDGRFHVERCKIDASISPWLSNVDRKFYESFYARARVRFYILVRELTHLPLGIKEDTSP